MTKRSPEPPQHLSASCSTWWKTVVTDFKLEDHHLRLLQLACEAWDRCQQAREILARESITFRDDRENIRPHPAITIEKDARTAFARLVRELDLDTEPPVPTGRSRPPALASNRG